MLYQNSTYTYQIEIEGLLDLSTVQAVEFSFGENLQKVYPSDKVIYENGIFNVKFTQEETLGLKGISEIQARVKYTNGDILPTEICHDDVFRTISKKEI